MKILKIASLYKTYVDQFYTKHPENLNKPYKEQKSAFDYDEFGWGDFWANAMNSIGNEMIEISYNVEPLQRAWAKENGINPDIDLETIAIEQIKRFNPEVLWYDDVDCIFFNKIINKVKSIRLTLGSSGSFIADSDIWKSVDIVLSSAPETVEYFRNNAIRSDLLSYAFDSRINSRLLERGKKYDVSFMGQIVRGNQFHYQREYILKKISNKMTIQIFSPSYKYTYYDVFTKTIWKYIYRFWKKLVKFGISSDVINKIPKIGKAIKWEREPTAPISLHLKKFMLPPVFGLEMFQAIKDSKICLNVHADSSSKYASNMRLYEITGVGSCMVTDWKENIKDFFEPDKEIITFKSTEECIEKINWLIKNPHEAEKIAKAGQMRTLKDHTFQKRAMILDGIIKNGLK